MVHWIDLTIAQGKKANKEQFKNRRSKYVTEKTVEYIKRDIYDSFMSGTGINEYGQVRRELRNLDLYYSDSEKIYILSYHGRVGDYGVSEKIVLDRRVDLEEIKKLMKEYEKVHRGVKLRIEIEEDKV